MSAGIDLKQFRDYVVAPTLRHLDLWSPAAERLVLATALAESGLRYIDQVDAAGNPGPAFGLFQMERRTHDDIWENFLAWRRELSVKVHELRLRKMDRMLQMHGNDFYAAAMCRIHYYRVPEALPEYDDASAIASYWKRYYNTRLGKGTVSGFLTKSARAFKLEPSIA